MNVFVENLKEQIAGKKEPEMLIILPCKSWLV